MPRSRNTAYANASLCCQEAIDRYEATVWPIEGPTHLACACGNRWTYRPRYGWCIEGETLPSPLTTADNPFLRNPRWDVPAPPRVTAMTPPPVAPMMNAALSVEIDATEARHMVEQAAGEIMDRYVSTASRRRWVTIPDGVVLPEPGSVYGWVDPSMRCYLSGVVELVDRADGRRNVVVRDVQYDALELAPPAEAQILEHPVQPIEYDEHGIVRFKRNLIVEYILEHGSIDMNELALLDFSDDDRKHFAQLIGYSVRGYGDLPYVDEAHFALISTLAAGFQPTRTLPPFPASRGPITEAQREAIYRRAEESAREQERTHIREETYRDRHGYRREVMGEFLPASEAAAIGRDVRHDDMIRRVSRPRYGRRSHNSIGGGGSCSICGGFHSTGVTGHADVEQPDAVNGSLYFLDLNRHDRNGHNASCTLCTGMHPEYELNGEFRAPITETMRTYDGQVHTMTRGTSPVLDADSDAAIIDRTVEASLTRDGRPRRRRRPPEY